jgi:hypothetical protein
MTVCQLAGSATGVPKAGFMAPTRGNGLEEPAQEFTTALRLEPAARKPIYCQVRRIHYRSAGFQTCCIADSKSAVRYKFERVGLAMVCGFGNPRYGRLGSLRYEVLSPIPATWQ